MNRNKFEQRKDEATGVLIDELWEIKRDIEKANSLLQELYAGYFDKYDVKNLEGKNAILCEYEKNKIYTDIIGEYVHKAKMSIESLEDRGDREVRSQLKEVKIDGKA